MKLLDNPDAHTHEGLKYDLINKLGTSTYFYPGGETDELAPVDARYGKDVKHEVGAELDKWLLEDSNLDKLEGGAKALTASDHRILMTCWVAEAKERVDKKYYSLWRYFDKMGGLITADGSGDSEICPTKLSDGVTNYVFQDPAAEAKECETAAMWTANRVAERKKGL